MTEQEYNKKVASKLAKRLDKIIFEDRKQRDRELKKGLKMLNIAKKGLTALIICSTMACSIADPASSGNSSGADAYMYSVPENGFVERTVRITRSPEGDPTTTGGVMYNRRSFSDWLFRKRSK